MRGLVRTVCGDIDAAELGPTGAAITTHTSAGTAALGQARLLEQAGADLSRVCVGHIFLPLLPEADPSEEDTRRLVVDNPARLLA